ncbi:MAG: hypothetical protein NC412_05260 [Roseburia sp.]|nr:hypothetical protein [Roseburia sp.]MCM1277577.1 hypothetical protein [Robinsoniella sp.]
MDNFMDELTKRFSAGEMIKANGEAEERELEQARERAAENEELLQEIRRLNLKNVELTEQAGQLIQCGIEQFEEYDKAADKTKVSFEEYAVEVRELFAKIEAYMEKISIEMIEVKNIGETVEKIMDEAAAENTNAENINVGNTDGETINIENINAETADGAADGTAAAVDTASDMKEQLLEAIKALEEHVHKENVKVYRNVQAVVMDQSTQKAREMGDRLDALERNAKKNNSLMPLTVLTFLAAAAALIIQLMGMF